MTADDKARELGIKYQTPCHGIGDCEFESYQSAKEMAAWKDEQFAGEKQELIEKMDSILDAAEAMRETAIGRQQTGGWYWRKWAEWGYRKAIETMEGTNK